MANGDFRGCAGAPIHKPSGVFGFVHSKGGRRRGNPLSFRVTIRTKVLALSNSRGRRRVPTGHAVERSKRAPAHEGLGFVRTFLAEASGTGPVHERVKSAQLGGGTRTGAGARTSWSVRSGVSALTQSDLRTDRFWLVQLRGGVRVRWSPTHEVFWFVPRFLG